MAKHEHKPVIRNQTLIAVRDVQASSRFYQRLLGFASGHGGVQYERLTHDGTLMMQLHAWEHENHPNLVDRDSSRPGHGVLLWFETDAFDAAVEHARALSAKIIEEPHVNPNSQQREIWLRDLDDYVVVISEAS
jgi:catechol 2,3-dioxygenase-like lactoylglutathione lyase family enzyme